MASSKVKIKKSNKKDSSGCMFCYLDLLIINHLQFFHLIQILSRAWQDFVNFCHLRHAWHFFKPPFTPILYKDCEIKLYFHFCGVLKFCLRDKFEVYTSSYFLFHRLFVFFRQELTVRELDSPACANFSR